MKNLTIRAAAGAALAFATLAFGTAGAAEAPQTLPIWPGTPPGTADWTGPEKDSPITLPGQKPLSMVTNVTIPTVTVYRPESGATGTGMVVIPGGGFQMLAMDHEGHDVARWLAARGMTAFVLKYRVRMIPGFRMPRDLRKYPERFADFAASFEPGRPRAIEDALQAMRYLRANAGHFGVAPDRIGMIGFSAGAITTMGVILNGKPEERPNLAAPIYGAIIGDKTPPADGPPLFLAVTQDDAAVPAVETLKIYESWARAGLPAELHVYESGGHGFGMRRMGKPVDRWTDALEAWLQARGWLASASNDNKGEK